MCVTEFCKVAANIFGIISVGFLLCAKLCTTSHAMSRKWQIAVRFTGQFGTAVLG
jgi:hypothetical protein